MLKLMYIRTKHLLLSRVFHSSTLDNLVMNSHSFSQEKTYTPHLQGLLGPVYLLFSRVVLYCFTSSSSTWLLHGRELSFNFMCELRLFLLETSLTCSPFPSFSCLQLTSHLLKANLSSNSISSRFAYPDIPRPCQSSLIQSLPLSNYYHLHICMCDYQIDIYLTHYKVFMQQVATHYGLCNQLKKL